jgi:hypothetical protein
MNQSFCCDIVGMGSREEQPVFVVNSLNNFFSGNSTTTENSK